MRQAGRYLPLYQELRAKHSFIEICQDPRLAAKATLDAAEYLDTDAAIIFSDITIPMLGMGVGLHFDPGPKLSKATRTTADIGNLRPVDSKRDTPALLEAIAMVRDKLPKRKALIGFVGAPLTMAGYMVEGAHNPGWANFKEMMAAKPETLRALLDLITQSIATHAIAQVNAGCDTIQLFDSNAGIVTDAQLAEFAIPYAKKAIEDIRTALSKREQATPIIYFARGITDYRPAASTGADVVAVDWHSKLSDVRKDLGPKTALMGNLSPELLKTGTKEDTVTATTAILDEMRGEPGFVFNLGHGILPKTPPENAKAVIDTIKSYT